MRRDPLLSIATNASLADSARVLRIIPHWLRVFGDRFDELVIVLDSVRPSGRIAALHRSPAPGSIREALREVARLDPRIRVVELPPSDCSELRQVTAKWFRSGHPVRCQAGTPILAFLYAIEQARHPLVLRADCDMLFYESGWLTRAIELVSAGEVDLVEPPRLGWHAAGQGRVPFKVTTRAMVLSPPLLSRGQPLVAHKVDPFRRLYRRLQGRSQWLSLEQMLQHAAESGRLSHRILTEGGFWLHVATHSQMEWTDNHYVIEAVERGSVPALQAEQWDLWPDAWTAAAPESCA